MKYARLAGIVVQALILGTLLFVAVGRLMVTEEGSRVFRYQGF
jgi:hypothetical protein